MIVVPHAMHKTFPRDIPQGKFHKKAKATKMDARSLSQLPVNLYGVGTRRGGGSLRSVQMRNTEVSLIQLQSNKDLKLGGEYRCSELRFLKET